MRTRAPLRIAVVLLAVGAGESAADQNRTRLIDPNTRFHRVFVVGNGDNAGEDAALRGERDGLRQRVTAAGNQAAGSTAASLNTPTTNQFRDAINAAFAAAQVGDEITIYFNGHGGTGTFAAGGEGNEPTGFNQHIRLNADNRVTDNQYRTMIEAARTAAGLGAADVTVLTILDSCYGGGFTGGNTNLGETKDVSVVGSSRESPFSTPGLIWGYWRKSMTVTLAEYVDAHGGEVVSGDDVKAALDGYGLGPPPADVAPKSKKSKYDGDADLADIIAIESAGDPLSFAVSGEHFTPGSLIQLLFFSDSTGPDGFVLGEVTADSFGSFDPFTVLLPSLPLPDNYIGAIDLDGYYDWEVVPAPGGGVVLLAGLAGVVSRRRRGQFDGGSGGA